MEGSFFKHKARSNKAAVIVGWVVLGIIGITAFAFLFGYVVMLLWNWIMPELFGLVTIGFWKAVGIILLAKLIFGGFGGGHGKSSHRDHTKSKSSAEKTFKNGFSKWKYYEKFWEEKGKKAFDKFVKEQSEDAIYDETDIMNKENTDSNSETDKEI